MHGENFGWRFGHSGVLVTVAKILSGINVGWRFGHSGVLDTVVFWSQWPKPCMSILTKWWIDPCQSMTVSMWLMSMHLITDNNKCPLSYLVPIPWCIATSLFTTNIIHHGTIHHLVNIDMQGFGHCDQNTTVSKMPLWPKHHPTFMPLRIFATVTKTPLWPKRHPKFSPCI